MCVLLNDLTPGRMVRANKTLRGKVNAWRRHHNYIHETCCWACDTVRSLLFLDNFLVIGQQFWGNQIFELGSSWLRNESLRFAQSRWGRRVDDSSCLELDFASKLLIDLQIFCAQAGFSCASLHWHGFLVVFIWISRSASLEICRLGRKLRDFQSLTGAFPQLSRNYPRSRTDIWAQSQTDLSN